MSDQELAIALLDLIGGKENVNTVVHCATRLRFQLIDEGKAKTEEINQHSGVIKVVQSGGQYQVVIGSHVGDVFAELTPLLIGNLENENFDETGEDKKGFLNNAIDIISAIFTPFIPALAGTGVLKGILSLWVFLSPEFSQTGTYQILNAAGDGFFKFLPIAIAFTASKKFKINQFTSVAIAMALVYPFESTESLNFFGIPVIYGAGYSSTVFPIIMAVFIQQYVERVAKKFVPKYLMFGTPLITLLVMVPLTFIVLGPAGAVIGTILGSGVNGLYGFSPLITGLLLGGLWQVLVMFGLHWGLVPLAILSLGTYGYDVLLPLVVPAVLAQAGASLAVMFKAKDKALKGLASSSAISAVFGITEPAVYGVTLPLRKPFVYACIGGALGGAINAISGVKSFAFSTSILIIPNLIGRDGVESNMIMGVVAILVGFFTAFILTLVLGFESKQAEEKLESTQNADEPTPVAKTIGTNVETISLGSPLAGKTIALEQVEDTVFSSGAMGRGLAIEPTEGKLFAPADGKIALMFPTGHAVGMKTIGNAEVLMHIGMDTVELEGEGFVTHVKQGDKVQKGQLLVEFDIPFIQSKGKSVVTPIVVTNFAEFTNLKITDYGELSIGEELVSIEK